MGLIPIPTYILTIIIIFVVAAIVVAVAFYLVIAYPQNHKTNKERYLEDKVQDLKEELEDVKHDE